MPAWATSVVSPMHDSRIRSRLKAQLTKFSPELWRPAGWSRCRLILWPHNRSIQAPVVATAPAGAAVGEAGGRLLVEVNPEAELVIAVHVAALDLGRAGEDFADRRRKKVLFLDPEIGADEIEMQVDTSRAIRSPRRVLGPARRADPAPGHGGGRLRLPVLTAPESSTAARRIKGGGLVYTEQHSGVQNKE